MKKSSAVVGLVLLSACGASPVTYTAQSMRPEQAIKAVERCLREQPGEYAPITVEVTNEFMSVVHSTVESSFIRKSSTSRDVAQTAYYASVADATLHVDDDLYIAMLTDATGEPIMRCYTRMADSAKRFIDGVLALKNLEARTSSR